jgi:membrane protease YdiL (CAAX protease family)
MSELLTPFLILVMIVLAANLAERRRRLQLPHTPLLVLAYGSTAVILLFALLIGASLHLMGVAWNSGQLTNDQFAGLGVDPAALEGLFAANLPLMGAGLWIPAVAGLLMLLPGVRRGIGRLIPIDPGSPVHALALALSMLVPMQLFVMLGLGLEQLAAGMVEQAATSGEAGGSSLIAAAWAQNIATLLLSFLGVGWLIRRSLRQSLERLAISAISGRQLLIGIGSGVGLLLVTAGVVSVGQLLGADSSDVEALSEQLYGPFFQSLAGILTVGLAAGLGEEAFFRGALQPRFGRFLTALLFALLHGNYGLSIVTLAIFAVGYLLGVLRDRTNTTTAMIAHAVYNMIQAGVAWLVGQGMIEGMIRLF